jgi:hypothetical protein
MSIATVGSFKLNLTLARGRFSSLSLLTESFDVVAGAIVLANSTVGGVYTMGDVLEDVTVVVSLHLIYHTSSATHTDLTHGSQLACTR